MRFIIKEVYTFDELDEKAKQVAINNFREDAFEWNWWEGVFEDAIRVGEILGVLITKKSIHFDCFYSQRDYCDVEGSFVLGKKDIISKITEYCNGTDEALIDLARQAEQLNQDYIATRMTAWFLGDDSYDTGHIHSFSGNKGVEISDFDEFFKAFAEWIHQQLYAEADYRSSDEYIIENIKMNEYDFDKSGNLI